MRWTTCVTAPSSPPVVLRNGHLQIAVSTEGAAPALAVRIRDAFRDRCGGAEYARPLELAGSLREEMASIGRSFAERRRAWYRLMDSPVLDLLRSGDDRDAAALAREVLGLSSGPSS